MGFHRIPWDSIGFAGVGRSAHPSEPYGIPKESHIARVARVARLAIRAIRAAATALLPQRCCHSAAAAALVVGEGCWIDACEGCWIGACATCARK